MNIDVKILNNLLANKIQGSIKGILNHNQVWFLSSMQILLNIWKIKLSKSSQQQTKVKNHMIILVNTEKTAEKIHSSFMIKTSSSLVIEDNFLNLVNIIYQKPTTNVKDVPYYYSFSTLCWKV